ncbi:uncharacterized protein L969DRAFT_14852 [Mixia osmundae IAM 14324]|uniref:Alpha/beta hydrolase fold-3 domain-containing protein n=1 Tax=Mixia osmundae (strain CBS 9802 / IAM 14324 / JCM 22182 / KY 12970) TaxID=764103 RepID=G7E577_MIXOS|nr:uncharacterized protein L969DRAFT_14852 [Mixia osmundae IAM 14324]KEI42656.1 hypothetical protein L969DRAFT_14852 [Mixia osmundae IAM 14324]GAA97987.1 hypothetical protein E5Q_04667 [Mixia osmundae IAM 14324]
MPQGRDWASSTGSALELSAASPTGLPQHRQHFANLIDRSPSPSGRRSSLSDLPSSDSPSKLTPVSTSRGKSVTGALPQWRTPSLTSSNSIKSARRKSAQLSTVATGSISHRSKRRALTGLISVVLFLILLNWQSDDGAKSVLSRMKALAPDSASVGRLLPGRRRPPTPNPPIPASMKYITLPYKTAGNMTISFDLYIPKTPPRYHSRSKRPALVYFHGGGVIVGTKQSWLPFWLIHACLDRGYIFISADYRLLYPSNGHDVYSDVTDLFRFIRRELNGVLADRSEDIGVLIDRDRIGVSGSSGGGWLAYLAAAHHKNSAVKVLINFYAMGGDFLSERYVVKGARNRDGLPPIDAKNIQSLIEPGVVLRPTCAEPAAGDPETGLPTNPRSQLVHYLIEQAVYLDVLTGHKGVTKDLEPLVKNELAAAERIPIDSRALFPQLLVSENWPPSYLLHGSRDSAVLVGETVHIAEKIRRAGVECKVAIIDGAEHSFDLHGHGPDKLRDAVDFLQRHLEL